MSSTAGTPPSPMVHLPSMSPELPKGGILINPDDPVIRPTIIIPTSPNLALQPPTTTKSPSSARIRFAPLPDPRPRSLSTGQNIGWTTDVDDQGVETRHMEVRNMPQSAVHYDTDESGEEDDEERRLRGRSWSKGMESSWKISKKILTVGMWDDKEDKTYDGGMPLKKSVSTGGMIGRWSSIEDRKRSMQGLPVPTTSSHRRMSSLDPSPSAVSPASPTPVKIKLMNGRVYGARRASEIAELQKRQREADEPEFVEWGHVKAAVTPTGGSFLGDDEDGGGMEWVKRRREERQKREAEKKEREAQEAAKPPLQHTKSLPEETTAVPTPIIQISEPLTPAATGLQVEPRQDGQGDVFEEDADDDEDDGDFPSDEEEEEDAPRTTSSAAGIEIMSRHHH